ncbi:MAG: hypothetical protein JSS81_19605 [Acidobacteria bacterium]|nr:hypothetical protein [Acidobacteriota bacterium]
MKHLIYTLSVIIFLTSALAAQNENLRGDEAIERLKQTGQYDSLMQAVKDSREKDASETGPGSDDAVGQTAKLVSADGSTGDNFGSSVAISGDTAIVGAVLDNVSGNFEGSAYIFVRSGTVWTEQARLTASGGEAFDFFGSSVAISGDTAIVGASNDNFGFNTDQGTAYIFVRSGTVWTQQAQLIAADGAANDFFGYSVSISGDTAIVGAYFDDVGAGVNQGSAYVFVRSGTIWTEQAQLIGSGGGTGDNFGSSVAISGDTAVVGADLDNVSGNFEGSAFVFVRSGAVWTEQARLTASGGGAFDFFGSSVAISGDTVVVGASNDDFGFNTDQGTAYIFVRSGTVWTQQAQLIAAGGAANDFFGTSVSISGNTVVVGTYLDDVGANADQGSAYVFVRSGTIWTEQPPLTASDGAADDRFGSGVAISGNNMIVGAIFDDVGANIQQGSAYVYRILGTGWVQEARKTAADGAAFDNFGFSVAISGDTAIVGAYFDDVGANTDQGSAYIFVRSGTVWTEQAQLIATGGAAEDQFGISVAIFGDTAIVGANFDDVGANANQGAAYVFVRSGTIWTQQAQLNATGGAAFDNFGQSVSISGETAVVGAVFDDVGAVTDQGSAYVFVRSGTVWTQQAQLIATGGAAQDFFGYSVSISGNTAIVGAYLDDVGANADQGAAYVFVRSGTVWTQQAQLTASDGATNDFFGNSVEISGETVAVGAFFDDVGAVTDQGSAYVFIRNGTVWTQQARLTAAAGAAFDYFGQSVSISGDTIVAGANLSDVGANANQGAAYVFVRSGGVWTQQTRLVAAGGAPFEEFGRSVSISGDKIIAGAPYSDSSVSVPFAPQAADQGAAFIFVNNLVPTAANVAVGGRVTAGKSGLSRARVTLTDENGETRSVLTKSFGNYRFDDLEAGRTYIVSVSCKGYVFAPQVVTPSEDLTELNFIAKDFQ